MVMLAPTLHTVDIRKILQEVNAVVQQELTAKRQASLKMLIVDDDPAEQQMLCNMLASYGEPDTAVTGKEAVNAFRSALKKGKPYNLICLDMLSETECFETLKHIRKIEMEKGIHGLDGVKIMMTTASGGSQHNTDAFRSGCEGYLKKPVDEKKLINLLKTLNFDNKILKKMTT